jgi:hypothetical protein
MQVATLPSLLIAEPVAQPLAELTVAAVQMLPAGSVAVAVTVPAAVKV